MARAGTVAVLLPGAFYVLREKQLPPVEAFRRHGVPIAIATDCNPGTSPLTSLLLTMNMAATLFRLTVEECLAGVTREAARALGRSARSARSKPASACDLAIWDIERPAELVYRIGFNPLHARVLEGPMTRRADARRRSRSRDWRAICARRARPARSRLPCRRSRRAPPRSPRSSPRASRSTASTPASASSRACASRRTTSATLQRNIVLSHAAGVGDADARRESCG